MCCFPALHARLRPEGLSRWGCPCRGRRVLRATLSVTALHRGGGKEKYVLPCWGRPFTHMFLPFLHAPGMSFVTRAGVEERDVGT